jgi:hypothetical protein
MRPIAVPNPVATALLGAFFLIANVGNALYAASGRAPSGAFLILDYVGFGFAVAYWIHADSRRFGVREGLDQGWFTYAAWPVVLPYHLFKTRGVRGAFTLAGLIALFAATYLASLLVFLAARTGAGAE